MRQHVARRPAGAVVVAGLLSAPALTPSALAQEAGPAPPVVEAPTPPAGSPAAPPLALQLNKLETVENGCRASFVLTNASERSYDSLKLDLVSFQPDGVIGQRLLVELAPVPVGKTLVKAFDFEGVTCGEIDRVLVNEVVACRTDDGEVDPVACLNRLDLQTLAADLWK